MKKRSYLILFLLFIPAFLFAEWSNNPAENFAVCDLTGSQALPKIATSSTGDTYISWFSNETGNYDARLQRFDVRGDELWAHNGILISNHPSMSWLTDWDMTVDNANHAILTFQDIRNGGNNNIYAYRISPEGDFVWGADGLELSNSTAFDVSPKVTVTNSGNTVIAWQSDDVIIMQKISPEGTLLWGPSGITLSCENTYSWPQLMPVGRDNVIMKFFEDTGVYPMMTRHVLAQKFNANGTQYARAEFTLTDTFYTANMLFYKISKASLISQDIIETPRRDIAEYVMVIEGNPIRFYSCHLKSSQGSQNEQKRLVEITCLRNHLNNLEQGTEFIIVGDMNFYTSSEPAYQKIIAADSCNLGRGQDLSDQVGNWHNNYTFREVHSQSSRVNFFGGGVGGGLDDRFGFIFTSYEINNDNGIEYIDSTLTYFGNDGNHFNQSINDSTNAAVPDSVADALYYASDHLPVLADFVSLDTLYTIDERCNPNSGLSLEAFPNPFRNDIRIELYYNNYNLTKISKVNIYNVKGQLIKQFKMQKRKFKMNIVEWNGKDDLRYKAKSGIYFIKIIDEKKSIGIKQILKLE
ncbi:MAG: T9SS type A sorting domain-containing protein [Candidatus Cloacimonadota bacterium]|nr:T9SS type A sorting domain-containing protein [Candidatus Cloacimonadota bacterium]